MKKLLLILLFAPMAFADSLGGGLFNVTASRAKDATFANLSAVTEGNFRYCTNCWPTSPCTSGGTGAFAFRVDTTWHCGTGASGTGDVAGPGSATDNAITRFDLATGKLIQNSTVTLTDAGAISNITSLTFTGSQDGLLGWTGGVGPIWTDTDLAVTQRHDIQNLSATRTSTWPDVTGTVVIGSAVATTVGAAGGASALPATPLGYLTITLPDGTAVKIPYYNP